MQRIRITKPYRQYKTGEILEVSNNEAFSLIDSGHAVKSKDMTITDYKTKKVTRKKNG